jgi:hypothetical protein
MRTFFAVMMAVATATFAACGNDSPTAPNGGGRLNVMLTDAPFADAKAVLVTFSEVSVHRADADWTTVTTSRTCDLKKLQGAQDVLGIAALEPGHYTQIRLTVSSAALYFENAAEGAACAPTIAAPAGRSAPLEISSGVVKLNHEFDLAAAGTTMVLDFDGDRSIHETGNGRFMMSPVIGVVSVQ